MLNDDRVLDARDMAEEIARAKATTCPDHEGVQLPCPFSHDEAVLADLDAVVGRIVKPRTFEDVINEWTETMLKENRTAPSDPHVLALILRLGVLGQRLIYEANDVEMRQVMEATKAVLNPVHDEEPPQ